MSISQNLKRRGLKPGQKHEGQFKPGYDARRNTEGCNVNGRKRQFQELVKDKTEKAVEVLVACMEDSEAPWRDRHSAAELILAHAHGKPVDRILMAQSTDGDKTGAIGRMLALLDEEGTPPIDLNSEGDDVSRPNEEILEISEPQKNIPEIENGLVIDSESEVVDTEGSEK